MQTCLPPRAQPLRRQMRVAVPAQQSGLIEDQRGIPDGGRAAEQGQDHPGEQRLHQKQQCGADKDSDSE
jgi:hypothetical protein